MDYLLPVLIFSAVLILVEVGYFALRGLRISEKKTVRTRLKALKVQDENNESVNIVKKNILSEIPWLHSFLIKFSVMEKVTSFLDQAGSQHKPGLYLLLCPALALIGFLAGRPFHSSYFPLVPSFFVIIPLASASAMLPFIYLRYKRSKRFGKFEEQFPEALDLIARSLKAGHAFSSGLRLASEEMDAPVGDEFEKTLNEINFGLSTQHALGNLAHRIPLDDLRFFTISVNLQRETGGNLAEILESLARLLRERFKFNGHVRVLASQAKLSAHILFALPFIIAFVIQLLNPKYFDALLENPSGKMAMAAGVGWMMIGILFIKKMVTIRV